MNFEIDMFVLNIEKQAQLRLCKLGPGTVFARDKNFKCGTAQPSFSGGWMYAN